MRFRWGLGPVFAWEWLTRSRRWQLYAVRALFVAGLLAAFFFVWWWDEGGLSRPSRAGLAVVGERFFYAIVGTQLALILLVAPAATAGAICQDKARGTLLHLLVTDLSSTELILGKLAARLVPVVGLVLAGLPVLFLATLLGGIDPDALVSASLITLGVAVLSCSLALVLSVWATRTHEVLLATYFLSALVVLTFPLWKVLRGSPPPAWDLQIDPFQLAFAPYTRPGTTDIGDAASYLGATLGISTILVLLAMGRVRAVVLRQTTRPAKRSLWLVGGFPRRRKGTSGLTIGSNPILWRERYRGQRPFWIRLLQFLYILGAAGFSLYAIINIIWPYNPAAVVAAWVNGLQVSFGLLLLSSTSVASLGEERSRGSLEVLLTTPLSTWQIVWGKWWGVYRSVLLLVILPTLVTGVMALMNGTIIGVLVTAGLILAYGAAVTSMGLALATWVARLGRAMALSVAVYVFVTVGWLMALVGLTNLRSAEEGLAMASPFFGIGNMTFMMGVTPHTRFWSCVGWDLMWMVVFVGIAVVLLWATLVSFDHCLGRVHQGYRKSLPQKKWSNVDD